MLFRLVLLFCVWWRLQVVAANPQCRAANMKFTVRSYRNQTGHWITKLQVESDASSGLAYEEGELQTGHWTVDVDQTSHGCDLATDAIDLAATITAPPALAGPGYELFHGIGRYKLHTNPKTWAEARIVCAKEGAHLAIPNSEAESGVLMQLLALHPDGTLKTNNNNYAFIGFNDIYQEGHYVTIFGEPVNQTGFTRWSGPGQPDNAGGNEDCGSLHRNGGLNDISCHYKLVFFCEQELW